MTTFAIMLTALAIYFLCIILRDGLSDIERELRYIRECIERKEKK